MDSVQHATAGRQSREDVQRRERLERVIVVGSDSSVLHGPQKLMNSTGVRVISYLPYVGVRAGLDSIVSITTASAAAMASCAKFVEGNKQCHDEKTRQQLILHYIDDAFIQIIPSTDVKEMAPVYRYAAGFTLVFLQIFIFIYFLVVGIKTASSTTFLTPLTYYQSSRCSQVLTSTTNTFYATQSGLWSTEVGISFAEMVYRFDLSQYSVSSSDLYSQLSELKLYLNGGIGHVAKNRTLGENVLFWTTFRAVSPDKKTTFSMAGDIKIVLNQPFHDVLIASKYGMCNASSVSAFSSTTGRFTVAFSYSEFMANNVCKAAISPSTAANMSYDSFLTGDKFTIEIDTQVIVTALNINMNGYLFDITPSDGGGLDIPGLSNIANKDGVNYYVDPLYPGMDYTICAPGGSISQPVLCGMQIGMAFALPVLLDQGLRLTMTEPTPCTCNSDGKGGISDSVLSEIEDASYLCNNFQFFVGVLLFNNDPTDSLPLLDFLLSFSNAVDANRAAFKAASYTSKYGPLFENVTSASYEDAFSFCDIYGGCTLINMATFSGANPRNIVSDYYFQLSFGACNDTLSYSSSALNELVKTPYGPLIESYAECIATTSSIYSNSLGITIGNIGAYIPVICLVLVTILTLYQTCSGKQVLASYTKSERDTALDALATVMLLYRDNKFVSSKDAPGLPPPSFDIVGQLVGEIQRSLQHNPDLQQIGLSEAAQQLADAARSRALEMEVALKHVKFTERNPLHKNSARCVDTNSSSIDDSVDVSRISAKPSGIDDDVYVRRISAMSTAKENAGGP